MILLDTSVLIEFFRRKYKENSFFYQIAKKNQIRCCLCRYSPRNISRSKPITNGFLGRFFAKNRSITF